MPSLAPLPPSFDVLLDVCIVEDVDAYLNDTYLHSL